MANARSSVSIGVRDKTRASNRMSQQT